MTRASIAVALVGAALALDARADALVKLTDTSTGFVNNTAEHGHSMDAGRVVWRDDAGSAWLAGPGRGKPRLFRSPSSVPTIAGDFVYVLAGEGVARYAVDAALADPADAPSELI